MTFSFRPFLRPVLALALPLCLLIASAMGKGESVLRTSHLELRCDDLSGRWTLATLQGLPDIPSDDNHPLTGSALNTFCVVRIDKTDRKFGSPEGRLAVVARSPNSITHSWTVGDIEVLQTLTLTNSPLVRHPASLKIRYWVRNRGATERLIGLRIVLDPLLGPNDNAPFLVPGLPCPLAKESLLRDHDVPDWWVSWDDPMTPFSRVGMVFAGPDIVKPDSIAFASRRRLAEKLWDFRPEGDRPFRAKPADPPDPAVALTWDPIPFEAGTSNGIAFHFGLVEPSLTSVPPSDLVLLAPFSVSTEAFQVLATVRNSDNTRTLKDASLSLGLPDGASLIGSATEHRLQDIPPTEQRLVSWRVRLPPATHDLTVSFSAKYGTAPAVNRVKRTVRVSASLQPR